MDVNVSSIDESNLPEIFDPSIDVEAAVISDLKMLDKEMEEDLVNAFVDYAESEDGSDSENGEDTGSDSENGEDTERNLLTDSSSVSEKDLSLESSPIHEGNSMKDTNDKNELNIYSYNEIEECNSVRHSDSTSNSQVSDNNTASIGHIGDKNKFASMLQDYQNWKSCSQHKKNELLEEITTLNSILKDKIKEAEILILKYSEVQSNYRQLIFEKTKCVSKISEEFLAQRKYLQFLESGTIEEINCLKLKIQHLEEEKSNVQRENILLKESFFQRWARSLILWPVQCLRRVTSVIGVSFF